MEPCCTGVPAVADASHVEAIRSAGVAELDALADADRLLRSTPCGAGEERRSGLASVGLVGLDGSGEQCNGFESRRRPTGEYSVGPGLVDLTTDEVAMGEQFEQRRAIGGRAPEHDGSAFERTPNPAEGHAAIRPPCAHDRQQRVAGSHRIAGAAIGIDTHPGADGKRQQRDRSGGDAVGLLEAFSTQARLHDHAVAGGFGRRQRFAPVDAQAPADDACAGALLGCGVVGWGGCIDAVEGEVDAVVEVGDDSGASEIDRAGQFGGRRPELLPHLLGDRRARCLGEHGVRPGAHADVAPAQIPDGAVMIGENVDLDLPHRAGRRPVGCTARDVGVESTQGRGAGADHCDSCGFAGLDQFDPCVRYRRAEPDGVDTCLGERCDHAFARE